MRRKIGMRGGVRFALVALAVMVVPSASAGGATPVLAPGDTVTGVLVGAGDIAGPWLGDDQTADLLDTIPGQVFTLGDNAYLEGTHAEYLLWYELTWGRHKARTRPAAGNHDFEAGGGGDGSGYFAYFGAAAGPPHAYYSYDVGAWHVIVLNGECSKIGGCGPGSPQSEWLLADLARHRNRFCTVAMFHYPRFNSGGKGETQGVARGQHFWEVLHASGVDLVLSGDEHLYERFAPMAPDGTADPEFGIRQFTVGTGGGLAGSFRTPMPGSEARIAGVEGVLKLTLGHRSYAWDFVPVAGKTGSDTGWGRCHGAPDDEEPVQATATR
jgi:acid phosphatase type 7